MLTIFFDTETTGLPKDWNKPTTDSDNWPRLVSLSWIVSDGKNSKEFDFIIKPVGFEIPEEVSKIHGITQERALAEGFPIDLVLGVFMAFLIMSDNVVAHNISFDKSILCAEFHRRETGPEFEREISNKNQICTMKGFMDKLNLSKWPKLNELHKLLFNEEFSGAHNSLMDTRACARCYFKLTEKVL